MQTTITIDEETFEQLTARASREGTTVARLIEDSVRLAARSQADPTNVPAFELITFGKEGGFTTLDVDRTSVLIEQDDLARHGHG